MGAAVLIVDMTMIESLHTSAQTMRNAGPCCCIVIGYAGLLCISAGNYIATAVMNWRRSWHTNSEVAHSGVTAASVSAQVIVYRLPSLPGSAPGESKGYAVSGQPLAAPGNSMVRTPAFGSAGIAATEGAEFVYVGSPAAPQSSPQLTYLFGVPSVYVFQVCPFPASS